MVARVEGWPRAPRPSPWFEARPRPPGESGRLTMRIQLRRRLLPLRCKACIEALALGRHLDEQLVGGKACAVFLLQPLAQLDELLRAHHVDVGERPARIGRV